MSDVSFVTTAGAIRGAVGYVQHAVCKEASMFALRSVWVDFRSIAHVGPDGSLRGVAGVTFACTDRYRLAWATVPETLFTASQDMPAAWQGDAGPLWDSAEMDPTMLDSAALFAAVKQFPKAPTRTGRASLCGSQ